MRQIHRPPGEATLLHAEKLFKPKGVWQDQTKKKIAANAKETNWRGIWSWASRYAKLLNPTCSIQLDIVTAKDPGTLVFALTIIRELQTLRPYEKIFSSTLLKKC